jgi:hypothetical protein
MSCNIREYTSIDVGDNCNNMVLTAFVGGKNGKSIQFTINHNYCALSEKACKDLI